jgi:hypothetical protein
MHGLMILYRFELEPLNHQNDSNVLVFLANAVGSNACPRILGRPSGTYCLGGTKSLEARFAHSLCAVHHTRLVSVFAWRYPSSILCEVRAGLHQYTWG